MTLEDLPELQGKLNSHVTLTRLSGEEIAGDLVEVCADGVSIDVDVRSTHEMAGTLLFFSLGQIASVLVTPRPLFNYFRWT